MKDTRSRMGHQQ